MKKFMSLLRDEEGATAIEYGLIAGLIAVAIIVILSTVGDNLGAMFGKVGEELNEATTKANGSP